MLLVCFTTVFLLQVSSYCQVPQTSIPWVTIDIIEPFCYNIHHIVLCSQAYGDILFGPRGSDGFTNGGRHNGYFKQTLFHRLTIMEKSNCFQARMVALFDKLRQAACNSGFWRSLQERKVCRNRYWKIFIIAGEGLHGTKISLFSLQHRSSMEILDDNQAPVSQSQFFNLTCSVSGFYKKAMLCFVLPCSK